ncbi:hypothetical protein EDC63_101278 [Sulfurirhabdus autotrophica]|uniref:Uncharacterized protein n=1 Tax=Sulfurirhabdus autotrophica TaxID=1706046 RepID=A0A4R3YGF5_9PROT|nr:hypothetical protein EDC63_101278 [Sulfurirhabdus autotrophica]
MFQILLNHFFRHLAYRGTKVPSCPKVPAPIFLFQVWKLFEQLARCAPLDPPHNLAWRHGRWATSQNVHMILAHHSFYYPDLKGFAGLSHQLPNSLRNLSSQHFVTVLRHPYKVILNLKNRMATLSAFHDAPPFMRHIIAAKADRLKPVV